ERPVPLRKRGYPENPRPRSRHSAYAPSRGLDEPYASCNAPRPLGPRTAGARPTLREKSSDRSRMRTLVDVAERVGGDVGVDLRGRDGGVPEQLLHDAHVGAALEQVRRE